MSCWEELGIQATQDKRAIKRAYAARLKSCRPGIDTEAFMRLRSAYEEALQFYDWDFDDELTCDYERRAEAEDPALDKAPSACQELDLTPNYTQAQKCEQEICSDCLAAIAALLEQDKRELTAGEWRKLLSNGEFAVLGVKSQLFFDIVTLCAERFRTQYVALPSEILKLLDAHFHWSEDEIRLERRFGFARTEYFMAPIWSAIGESSRESPSNNAVEVEEQEEESLWKFLRELLYEAPLQVLIEFAFVAVMMLYFTVACVLNGLILFLERISDEAKRESNGNAWSEIKEAGADLRNNIRDAAAAAGRLLYLAGCFVIVLGSTVLLVACIVLLIACFIASPPFAVMFWIVTYFWAKRKKRASSGAV